MPLLTFDELTLEELKSLSQEVEGPAFSIFMPTHRAGRETQQDPIRFGNLLRDVRRQLAEHDMGPRAVDAFVGKAQELLENSEFWRFQYDGLAVYIAQDDFHVYRLPFPVEEFVIQAHSYYVKPLLPIFTNNGHFYILAISQNEIRMFEGTQHSVGEIDLPESVSQSMEGALQFDDTQEDLQFHTGSPQGGIRDALFHGHGEENPDHKTRIGLYLNQVDANLRDFLHEKQTPLVLAGVDYLMPIYREVSEYAKIMPEGVRGNPEMMQGKELQAEAWPLVEPYFQRETDEVIGRYQQLVGTGQASHQLEEIVSAAYYGRVDALVLATDTQVWGMFDRESGKVTHSQEGRSEEDDLALVDFAALQTLHNGGTVYALSQAEMPTDEPALAVFRY